MRICLLLCCVLLSGACVQKDDQSTGSIEKKDVREARAELSPAAARHLDAGNVAYKDRNYPVALQHYQEAARIDEKNAAPWFGIYMTQLAMGHAAAADSALRKARKLAPGASILR